MHQRQRSLTSKLQNHSFGLCVLYDIKNSFSMKWLEKELGRPVGSGSFGAMMEVALINSGPVTILIDSQNKE